jgi:hypothetical protein
MATETTIHKWIVVLPTTSDPRDEGCAASTPGSDQEKRSEEWCRKKSSGLKA